MKSLSFFDLVGWRSFLSAFASICLILSLVTPNSLPTSSSVLLLPSSSPNLNCKTLCSLWLSDSRTKPTCDFNKLFEAASTGDKDFSSLMKSARCESSSSPIGVSKDTGSCDCLSKSLN